MHLAVSKGVFNFIGSQSVSTPTGQCICCSRGVQLSGGQKQRIAIARVLLSNSPIMLLDEATSALDAESEAYLQEALGTVMHGKTVVVVAHRLSTIKKATKICFMERGQIVEQGTHDELVQASGRYAQFIGLQLGNNAHLPSLHLPPPPKG